MMNQVMSTEYIGMEDDDGELHSLISVKLNVVNVKISRQIGQAVQAKANLRLLNNDLLRFEGHDTQARNVRLCLTDKGSDVHLRIGSMMEQHKAQVLSALSRDEKQSLYNCLLQIEKSVDSWYS